MERGGLVAAAVPRQRESALAPPGGDAGAEIGEASERARGQTREHVVFRVPGRPAGAFDHEGALLAVERTEMIAIAGRHLDAGNGRDVEARLVEHHDDVRAPGRRAATRPVADFQTDGSHCVGLEEPLSGKLRHRLDAGAHELAHEAVTVDYLV